MTVEEKRIEDLEKENVSLREKVSELKQQLKLFAQRMYGRRSERFEHPGQGDFFQDLLDLPGSSEEPLVPESIEEISYKRKKLRKYGPKPLPEHLERVREVIDLPEEQRLCSCGKERVVVAEKITEELEIVPPKFFVRQLVRLERECADCMNRPIAAPLPPRPIERGRPSISLLAYIVVSKYVDHLPLYRQEQMFKRSGIHLARSTMSDWLGPLSGLLLPIVEAMKKRLLESSFLQSDDTRIQVLDRELKGKSRRCYLWAYCLPAEEIVYHFSETRSAKFPKEFLGDWSGDLQCDGYAGYDALFRSGRVRHIDA